MATNAADDAGVSAYEAKRQQRIQQNQQLLLSLGIQSMKKAPVKRVVVPRERVDPRRSSRLVQQQEKNDEKIATLLTLDNVPRDVKRRLNTLDNTLDGAPRRVQKQRVPAPKKYVPRRVKPRVEKKAKAKEESLMLNKRTLQSSMLLDIKMDNFHANWLGNQLFPRGKDTVMQGLCPPTARVSYGKMSGVQSWRNAVTLFVNVLGASGYDNGFTETSISVGGDAKPVVYFRWFAQGRHHLESPVIMRLLAANAGHPALWLKNSPPPPSAVATSTPEPVLLFLRNVDGPYIYCGRLGYLGHVAGSLPLEFRWQLMDIGGAFQWSKIKPLLDAPTTQLQRSVPETIVID